MKKAQDWIQNMIDTALDNYQGRTIVLWGKYNVNDDIKKRLKKIHGITDVIYVDSDIEKQDNKYVFSPEILHGNANRYYVLVPLPVFESIRNILKTFGGGTKDFYYFSDCVLEDREDYYEDAHGNRIIGKRGSLQVVFRGWNASITIGKGCQIRNSTVYIHTNGMLKLGKVSELNSVEIHIAQDAQCKIKKQTRAFDLKITCMAKSVICIGKRSFFAGGRIYADNSGHICIGKDFSAELRLLICANERSEIFFGEDCMLSEDVIVRCGDGHSIFYEGVNINSTKEIQKQTKTIIGNHVWIGLRTIIMRSSIGDGSIVGAGAVVKGVFPENCTIAGVPGKIIRKGISWDRKYGKIEETPYEKQ